jgi:hypothetical protein
MNRQQRAQLAQETLAILEQGFYTIGNGLTVDQVKHITFAVLDSNDSGTYRKFCEQFECDKRQ